MEERVSQRCCLLHCCRHITLHRMASVVQRGCQDTVVGEIGMYRCFTRITGCIVCAPWRHRADADRVVCI
jgi:hypothetical protein